jgi:hypothetical protein
MAQSVQRQDNCMDWGMAVCQILIKTEFFERFKKKITSIKFNASALRGSREFACGQTAGQPDIRTDRHTDIRTAGQLDIRTSGQLDIRTSGQLDIRTSGQLDIRTSGQLYIQTSGQADS